MENINSCLTIPNDLSLTIKVKNFYLVSTHNVPVREYERSSFAIGVRDWTQPHSATSRNDRNMFGIVRKSWKFFFGNVDKMHTKVSLL